MEEPGTDAGGELSRPGKRNVFHDGPAANDGAPYEDDDAPTDPAAPGDDALTGQTTESTEAPPDNGVAFDGGATSKGETKPEVVAPSEGDATTDGAPSIDGSSFEHGVNGEEAAGTTGDEAPKPVVAIEPAGSADDVPPAGDAGRVRVRVRRARRPGSVFGETRIVGRPPPDADDIEEETMPDLAAWVRHAAVMAALRTGAQACVAGVFMGVVLGFFLSGLVPGVALLLGLALSIGAVPVGILAGFATYRQTLESERARSGLCPRCGYDLRGLNTARCPECGVKLRAPRQWQTESEGPGDEEGTE